MNYIPGMNSGNEAQQLKSMKEILGNLSDADLDHPEKINGAAKERIAKKTGKPIEEISRLLMQFKNTAVLQEWLALKLVYY